jgi:AcrR family transcriptional regulator
MVVSGQEQDLGRKPGRAGPEKGPRVRMRRHMLETAIRLMQGGIVPSVSDVAEAAEVSRATAYRYFPSQAAMIQAVVDEALGPVLDWNSDAADPEQRIADLVAFAYPRMMNYEATHRAALSLALSQWARRQAGTLGVEPPVVRGNRKLLLREAAAPMKADIGPQAFDKLAQSLSLIFGIEAIIVLRDIWGLDPEQARGVALWAAKALVRAAGAEISATGESIPEEGANKAAPRPRSHRKRS